MATQFSAKSGTRHWGDSYMKSLGLLDRKSKLYKTPKGDQSGCGFSII